MRSPVFLKVTEGDEAESLPPCFSLGVLAVPGSFGRVFISAFRWAVLRGEHVTITSAALCSATWLRACRQDPAVPKLILPGAACVHRPVARGRVCARARCCKHRWREGPGCPLARGAGVRGGERGLAFAHAQCESRRSAGAQFGALERARRASQATSCQGPRLQGNREAARGPNGARRVTRLRRGDPSTLRSLYFWVGGVSGLLRHTL